MQGAQPASANLLPFVKRTMIATPRRGQNGVLAFAAARAQSGEADHIRAAKAKRSAEEPYCDILPPLSDIHNRWTSKETRKQSVNEAVQVALDIYDGLSVVVKPWSSRTKKRQNPKRLQKHDLVEAQRALRSLTPGDWDAELFGQYRRQFLEDGHWSAISGLTSIAAQATKSALAAGKYSTTLSGVEADVKLATHPRVQWFAFANVANLNRPPKQQAPPLICMPAGPIDAVMAAREIYPSHFIVMSFEATDFAGDGSLLGLTRARSAAQQELFIRTNLETHMSEPSIVSQAETIGHLTAAVDPYIIAANDVMVMRGNADQGYPFLNRQEATSIDVLVSGRAAARPAMGKDGEHFDSTQDKLAHLERLHLVALGANTLSMQDEKLHAASGTAREKGARPVLVIAAHDLTAAGVPQPREGIASTLKSWRQLYAGSFEAVIIACGDAQTASIMDKTINGSMYATALIEIRPVPTGYPAGWRRWDVPDSPVTLNWPWNKRLLELSVNGVLSELGSRVRTANFRPDAGDAEPAFQIPEIHVPDAASPLVFREQQDHDRTVMIHDAFHETEERHSSKQRWGSARGSVRRESFTFGLEEFEWRAPGGGEARGSTSRAAEPRFSASRTVDWEGNCGAPSRAMHEQAFKNRMADSQTMSSFRNTIQEERPTSKEDAQMVGVQQSFVMAINALTQARFSVRNTGANRKKLEHKIKKRKRDIESRAAALEMPEDLKVYVTELIEAFGNDNEWKDDELAQHQTHMDVQSIAGSLQSTILTKQGLTEGSSPGSTAPTSPMSAVMATPRLPTFGTQGYTQEPLPKIGGLPKAQQTAPLIVIKNGIQ